ncbi:unnamed protein product, partial [Brassica rapa subsp. narinosa]
IFVSLSFPLSSPLPELWNKAAHGGSVSGVKARLRRLLQLHRRRFLSPRGGDFVSSAVFYAFGLVRVGGDLVGGRSKLDHGSREAFLSVLVMNALVDPGESTVGYPVVFRSEGDVRAAAFVRTAAEPHLS